ncbi:hypothetical protein ES703_105533 [subsurface metagenome]
MGTGNSSPTNAYWLCPLYSFDCDCESVDLAEGIQIKHAPSELREYIRDRTYHLYGRWDDPGDVKWMTSLPYGANASGVSDPYELARIGHAEGDRARDLLFNFITASRLCHEGAITAGPLISASTRNSEWSSIGGTTIWTSVSKFDYLHKEPNYILHQSDVSQINELMKNLNNLRKEKKLPSIDVALRRFHSAYHGDIEDRIIDQMIAFESLYLGDAQELRYKLALRTALLLDKDENTRKIIFSDMKKAYDLRSQIVHGDRQPGRDELRDIVPKTEDYLRQSIRRFLLLLSQGKTLKEIRSKLLDENILKNGRLLALKE